MAAPMRRFFCQLNSVLCANKTLHLGKVVTPICPVSHQSLLFGHNLHCHNVLFQNATMEPLVLKKSMESLTDKFAEARELLGDARESQGTVYFSEDLEEAQAAVNETLAEYRDLLDRLSDKQRQELISTLGLRMEELRAQQAAIEEELKE
ncbi:uncharacterized protein LOC128212895 [Mya arenaria]|uniref:uncharacterized protein LOC128212895 n=1 Tax=Mya arenaria TaxID=6604 RepID=UPI0022E511EF|nr:uncharacterized protein LOC128212895 [Mya arenaria]